MAPSPKKPPLDDKVTIGLADDFFFFFFNL